MKKESKRASEKSCEKKPAGPGKRRTRGILFGAGVLILAVSAGSAAFVLTARNGSGQEQNVVRRNVQGGFSDTVTEEGSVSVGTVSQTFELDLSEYEGNADFSWNSGQMGGMNFNIVPGGKADGITYGNSVSAGTRQLTVEEVYVKVGEEIKTGDPILKVTAATLEDIRQGFVDDVTEAKEVYDQMLTQQKQTENEALAALKENQLYGAYADTEYDLAIEELKEKVEELTESAAEEQESMAEEQEELHKLQETLEEQKSVLESAEYVVKYEDRQNDAYGWLTAVNARVDLETTIENLESEMEALEESLSQREETLAALNMQLTTAQKELETGTIEAESKRQTRQLLENSAQEIYDVTTQLSAYYAENAKEDYESALEKLSRLDTYIADQVIYAAQDGVITAVSVAAGDILGKDTELIACNSYDDVTITLTLDEDDMDAAALGSRAEVTFSAFPNEIFEGEVTEIGDAQIDSNTNTTTYQVVVTILENGSRLYEGMSAEVTFTRPQAKGGAPEDAGTKREMPEGTGTEEDRAHETE